MPPARTQTPVRTLRLDTGFLRQLDTLRFRLRKQARFRPADMHDGADRGGESDFREHRPYADGDDLRRIDWNVYARTGEAHIKVFGHEPTRHVRVLPDLSPSMHACPEKEQRACELAAALAYLALAGGHTVTVAPLSAPSSSGVQQGAGAFCAIVDDLEHFPVAPLPAWTDVGQALATLPHPPGVTIIISDFWEDGAVPTFATLRKRSREEICLLQILSSQETHPSLRGPVCLHDAETGEHMELTLREADCARVAAATEAMVEALKTGARHHRLGHCLCTANLPLDESVLHAWRCLQSLHTA